VGWWCGLISCLDYSDQLNWQPKAVIKKPRG
jgi:hypothetical protein